ncbi:NB-ARC domain-containing protein [Streptomyces luteireticuli]|uniref:ATP-binding protein n=1 Tax=Streptomyces luteireticuli TaxID=173858 RepID=UPI0035568019
MGLGAIGWEAVRTAVETAVSAALSGAAGEMGRRAVEGLVGLLRREGAEGADALPVTADDQARVAEELRARALDRPEYADALLRWMREVELLRAAPGDAPVPRMLPADKGVFTDRDDVLAGLVELLEERRTGGATVAVVCGPGGIGKSATAVHCGHRLVERFPDGQLYVRLGGGATPSDVLAELLAQLGEPAAAIPSDLTRQRGRYRELTADRRLLVLLDDARSEAQVRALVPAAAGSLVLVTSRHRLSGLAGDPGARFFVLDPLAEEDAVLLLERVVAAAGRRPVARDAAGAVAVARGCAGVPLALCGAGSLLGARRHLSWETVGSRLSGNDEGVRHDLGADDGVRRSHDLSYRELSPEAARLYRLLAGWPWPGIGPGAAARAAGTTEGAARVLLEELAGVHLLEEVGEERYRFHDLVREHAERWAREVESPADRNRAVRRAAGWYLEFAVAADFRVMPGRWRLGRDYEGLALPAVRDRHDARDALAALRREREGVSAAVRAAESVGADELVCRLCQASWALHLRLGFHDQWIDGHRLGIEAARRLVEEGSGDPRFLGRMLVQSAFGHMGRGAWDEAGAALDEAVAAEAAAGHRRGLATAAEARGLLRLREWRWREAEECFRAAQGFWREIGPDEDGADDVPRGLALLEDHIGRALRGRGRFAEAAARLNAALAMFRALPVPDLYNEGRVYMSLGETHLGAGDAAAARVCLDDALEVMDREGAELQHADAAELRARCAEDAQERASFLRRAEELYAKGGDEVGVARVRERLAECG